MGKQLFEIIFNFNSSIGSVRASEGYSTADKLITSLQSLQKEIAPLLESAPRGHAFITSSGKMSLMSTVCALGQSSAGMSAVDQVRVLEAAFTGDGPFATVEFPFFMPAIGDGQFLAACYQFVMRHAGNTNDTGSDYLMAVALLGFAGGTQNAALLQALDEVNEGGGHQARAETVEFLIRELPHNPKFDNQAALTLYANGGLDRCLELSIDPKQLLARMIKNLEDASLPLADLRKLHAFCNEVNNHLFSCLVIPRKTHNKNAEALIELALDLNKGSGRVMQSSSTLAHMNLTASQLVKIASFSNRSGHIMQSRISMGGYEESDLKAAVQSLDASVQYQVIDRLQIKNLYTSSELNLITGRRLERDLGL